MKKKIRKVVMATSEHEITSEWAGFVILTDFRDTLIGKRIGAAHNAEDHGPFSPEELKALIADAGFVNVTVETIKNWVLGMGQKR